MLLFHLKNEAQDSKAKNVKFPMLRTDIRGQKQMVKTWNVRGSAIFNKDGMSKETLLYKDKTKQLEAANTSLNTAPSAWKWLHNKTIYCFANITSTPPLLNICKLSMPLTHPSNEESTKCQSQMMTVQMAMEQPLFLSKSCDWKTCKVYYSLLRHMF